MTLASVPCPYQLAGHPWLALLSRPLMHVEYNATAAEDSWRRMLDFFSRHLAGA